MSTQLATTPLDSRFTDLMPPGRIELREGYAEVGDQRLHYVEAGEGPLLLLLHGFPEFWFGWRRQIEPLAIAGFRVVAPDTRGYNLSSKPEGFKDYAVDLLAADIRDLIGALGAESARRLADEQDVRPERPVGSAQDPPSAFHARAPPTGLHLLDELLEDHADSPPIVVWRLH